MRFDQDNDLGAGFTLVPLFPDIDLNYSHLYKNGKKVSDEVFRRGGMCTGFKGDYCDLLQYNIEKNGIGSAVHVIVNLNGNIVFTANTKPLEYPYLCGGCVLYYGGEYFNLLTGKSICKGTNTIKSTSFIFVAEGNYRNEVVKRIDLTTGEIIEYN